MFRTSRPRGPFFRKSGVEYSLSPRALRWAFSAVRRKCHGRDARNFDRILERQEHALGGALVRRHLQQVFAPEQDFAVGDFIARLAGDDVRQRRFAGAVRPHDRVHLARVHGERQPMENLALLDTDLQIFHFKQRHCFPFLVPRPEDAGASKDVANNHSSHPSRRPLCGLLRMRPIQPNLPARSRSASALPPRTPSAVAAARPSQSR